jgi:hypothetical protein
MLFRGSKCRFHGGLSLTAEDKERISKETGRQFKKTGPATPEGKARSYAARDAGWRYWKQRLANEQGL